MAKRLIVARIGRRFTIVLFLLMAPGLIVVEPVAAALAPPEPRPLALPVSSPALRLPAPSIPSADGALTVPDDWDQRPPNQARRAMGALPAPGTEVVARRDAVTQVFANADRTETVKIHGDAVHFQRPGSPAWEPVDNTLVPDVDRPGWVRSAANAWTARFGPLTPGGRGVELETKAGLVRVAPELPNGAKPIGPVVGKGDDADSVIYANVWPGVDVRYTVTGSRLRYSVIASDATRTEFPFVVEGLDGRATLKSAMDTRLTGSGARRVLSANPGRPSGQATSVEPLVLQATAVVGASQACSYGLDPSEVWCDGVSTGTNRYPPAQHWWLRGVAQFNYRPYVEDRMVNGQRLPVDVLYAGVWMSQSPLSTPDFEPVNIWEATGWSGHGAVAGGDPAYWIGQEIVTDDNHCFGADVCFDVTEKMHNWQLVGTFNGWWDGKFGFSPDEEDYPDFLERFSYKNFDTADITLVMNLNTRPPAPSLNNPAPGALAIDTMTPTLRWNAVTDLDGEPVKYTAKIATGPDGQSGLVATSPETTGLEWTVPSGVLQDGLTYYWTVFANDTKAWTRSLEVRKLVVDRRLGSGGASASDSFSGVSTNLVTGNVSLSVSGPEMRTVGGGIGVGFVYNGRSGIAGLQGTYREDKDKDQVVDPEDPVKLVRTDARVSFDWGAGSPSPAVPVDYFLVNWSGTVRTPAGNWQFGVRADDGTRIWIDGVKVLDRWGQLTPSPEFHTGGVSGLHRIQFDYYEHSAPAFVELWARNAANPSQAFVVPADWLQPDSPSMAAGWSLQGADTDAAYTRAYVSEGSVVLTEPDGDTSTFTKQDNGGYRPPGGVEDVVVVNPDGTVSVHDDAGLSYVFRQDGGLESITTALDDRRPAAARNYFDSLARLSEIGDPVSGRRVTFTYARSDGDSACPNVPPLGSPADYESENGLLCRVSYWDGTSTDLYYFKNTDLLSHIANPGDAWHGFSYDPQARLTTHYDPIARDALFSGARTDSDLTRVGTQIGYTGDGFASKVVSVTAPAAQQADTQRPQHSYVYTQNIDGGGILVDGTATVTRAGVSGTFLGVAYDYRGRTVSQTNVFGQTSRSYWDLRDLQVASETPDGLLTSTFYNNRHQPTDAWGPAPKDWFDKVWYGSDYYFPKPDRAAQVPHGVTRYDEGTDGLEVKWWNNINSDGPVQAHQYNAGPLREDFPPGTVPEGVNGDNISARLTGDIVFGAAGKYQLEVCAGPWDLAALYVDDNKITDVWSGDGVNCSPRKPFSTLGDNEAHRIRVDYVDLSGNAMLHLNWIRPGGALEPVPGAALRPGYGLVTSTVDEDGKTTRTEYTDPAAGIGPQHGLVTRRTIDPGGLNLTETTTYEPAGGSDRFLRGLTKTLPSGPGSTTHNEYYGRAELVDNPCTPALDEINQGGMLKREIAADPDESNTQTPIARENFYGKSGRIVASRSGSGALTANDWTCTGYDARGRVTQVRHPAFDGAPARTVTNSYLVDPDGSGPRPASPLVTTIADPVGTITAETDLLGRVISYRDVFGNTTTFTYDVAGRETASNSPQVGQIVRTYDNADRLTSLSRGGAVLANGFAYDNASRLRSVTYPAGAGNNTKGTFDYQPETGRLKKITWTGPGGTLLTSDEVTRTLGGDVIGQVVDGVDHHAGNDFRYDAAGRLLEAWLPGARYQYDLFQNGFCAAPDSYRNANRTGMTITPTGGSAVQTHYCYDHADRLTGATDPAVGSVSYDRHGNTTGIFGETHTYDSVDRHLATTKGSTTLSYVRDATDRIVERRVNGVTVARYGSTGSGDAPGFTTTASNQVLEVTVALPGGALLTTRGSGNVWSYPNIHGDIVATANQSGAKQGATRTYDPFGNPRAGGLPDNSYGELDYGWLGQHQRPLEHEATLQPIIEMGARQYSPLLGRFLEVDPVEGGSANDYDYVGGDPVNNTDLDGTKCSRRTKGTARQMMNVKRFCFTAMLKIRGELRKAGRRYIPDRRTFDGHTRYVRASGECSWLKDTGATYDFQNPCKAHDLCYDYVRAGIVTNGKDACDAVLVDDLFTHCKGRHWTIRNACRFQARKVQAALKVFT